MRRRVRNLLVGVIALAAAVPATVIATATPAAASPVGYIELSVENFPTSADDANPQQIAGCAIAQVDLGTGAISALGLPDEDACVDDLALAPDGSLYGIQQQCEGEVTSCFIDGGSAADIGDFSAIDPAQIDVEVHLIKFDLTTGAPTDLGPIGGEAALAPFPFVPSPFLFGGLSFDKNGNLFVEMIGFDVACDGDAVCLYRVDINDLANPLFLGTGENETLYQILAAGCGTPEAVTLQIDEEDIIFPFGDDPSAQAFPFTTGDALLTSRNLTNGAVTPIGGVGEDIDMLGMAFDSDGTLWGIGLVFQDLAPPTQNVFTINTSTGVATPVAELDVDITEAVLALGLALPLDCPDQLVVAFTG